MLERVQTAHEALRGATPLGLSRPQLADTARALARLRSRVAALETDVATAVDGLGDNGADSAETMRGAGRRSRRAARKLARRAKALESMPNTKRRLLDGDLTDEHVDSLIDAAEQTSFAEVDGADRLLDDAAARPADMAARDIRDWTRRRCTVHDHQQRQQRRRQARSLSLWDDDDGMTVIHGRFDPVTGSEIKALIDAETDRLWHLDGGRDNATEVRTPEQRRADALHQLLHQPTTGTARSSAPPHPRTQLIVIAETSVISGQDPHGRCEIPGTGPIPRSELDRLACEAAIFGVIFDGDGNPLWLGRENRLATPDQWRALIARDRGCVLCNTAPIYCQAHHITAWQPPTRGPTNIKQPRPRLHPPPPPTPQHRTNPHPSRPRPMDHPTRTTRPTRPRRLNQTGLPTPARRSSGSSEPGGLAVNTDDGQQLDRERSHPADAQGVRRAAR